MMTHEWKGLRLPDVVVVDGHEDDTVRKGQTVVMLYITGTLHA